MKVDWSEWVEYKEGLLYWIKCTSSTGSGPNQPGKLAGCNSSRGACGYSVLGLKGVTYSQHRIIWELHFGAIPEGYTVDHIDRNKRNNLIENLRLADVYLQNSNRDSNLINCPETGRWKRKQ